MTYKHFFKGAKIGTGNIVFRDFAPVPTLATPQNVSIDGTTLSWDEVENATSYDIYADGTLIGNTEGGAVSSGETWVLNEYVNGDTLTSTMVSFTSNNIAFTWINVRKGYIAYSNSEEWDEVNMVYDTAHWLNETYRTITLSEPASGDLLTWLQENGTKQ